MMVSNNLVRQLLLRETTGMKQDQMIDPFLITVEFAGKQLLFDILPSGTSVYKIFYHQRMLGEMAMDCDGKPWAVYCAKEFLQQFDPECLKSWCPLAAGLLLNRDVVARLGQQIAKALVLN
jgi:hypothetical protein